MNLIDLLKNKKGKLILPFLIFCKKEFFIFLVIGMVYFSLEGLYRGWTHGLMIIIGGLCGMILDLLTEYKWFYQLKMYQNCFIGLFIIWVIEFLSGYILRSLGIVIWYYTGFGNILGLISIPFGLLVFLPLIPFCIWLGDYIRYKFFGEREIYPIWENYLELFQCK